VTGEHGRPAPAGNQASEFRSGFVTVVGRPNVGKSTLVNRMVGQKVSIVSDRPQTTRSAVRGVRTTARSQIVFIDTPGIHKPRTLLGERVNERALATLQEVDVVCLVVAADAAIGPGDRFVAERVRDAGTPAVLAVSKIDRARPEQVLEQLARASSELGEFEAYVPLSSVSGDGVDALVGEVEHRLPPGPHYYPEGVVTDQPESYLAAELLREQLLAVARDELPHSIAVTTEELEARESARGPLLAFRLVVRVERESQKGIVIGRGGATLRDAGAAARRELEALLGTAVHLDVRVKVEPDWQRRAHALDRLGF
jgi:GTP-binding protein Era